MTDVTIDCFTDEELELELAKRAKNKFPIELITYVHEDKYDEDIIEWIKENAPHFNKETINNLSNINYEVKLVYLVDYDGNTKLKSVNDLLVVHK